MSPLRACLFVALAACGTAPLADDPTPNDDPSDTETDPPRDDSASWGHDTDTVPDDTDTDAVDTDTDVAPNVRPTCTIVAPAPGANPEVGDAVVLRAQTRDDDDAAQDLDVSWTSDVDGLLVNPQPDSGGASRATIRDLSFGPHVLTLLAVDPHGADCTATVDVVIGTPPTATFTAPTDGDTVAEGASVELRATARDGHTGPNKLDVVLSSDLDGELWRGAGGAVSFSTSALSRGDHLITLSVTDDDGLTAEDTLALRVDGLPTTPVVTVTPEEAFTLDDLVATLDVPSTDPDGDAVTYTWAWTVDGVPAPYTDTVPATATTRGEWWELTVTPNDGTLDGVPAVVGVGIGDAPSVGGIQEVRLRVVRGGVVTPVGTPLQVADTLLVEIDETWTDLDGDPTVHDYQWYLDRGDLGFILIAGETDDTLAGGFAKGDRVQVRLRPLGGGSEPYVLGPWKSASTVCVDTPPSVPVVALSPAVPMTGLDDLECDLAAGGVDPDAGDVVTYTVSWTVDGAPAPAGSLLTRVLPGDTVDATTTAPHEVWACTISASDGTETSTSAVESVEVFAP